MNVRLKCFAAFAFERMTILIKSELLVVDENVKWGTLRRGASSS
jgi:hypothetical protein